MRDKETATPMARTQRPRSHRCSSEARSREPHMRETFSLHLTRIRSVIAAGESERDLQWTWFHKVKRGRRPASGWLHRMVRWGCLCLCDCIFVATISSIAIPTMQGQAHRPAANFFITHWPVLQVNCYTALSCGWA